MKALAFTPPVKRKSCGRLVATSATVNTAVDLPVGERACTADLSIRPLQGGFLLIVESEIGEDDEFYDVVVWERGKLRHLARSYQSI